MKCLPFLTVLAMAGCINTASLTDDQLAATVHDQVQADLLAALTLATAIDKNGADIIKADSLVAKQVIDGPIMKLFTDPTTQVTLSTINTALTICQRQITSIKNGPMIFAAGQAAITTILSQLQLPTLPTQTLAPRTKGALIAALKGASDAIGSFTMAPK